MNAATVSFKTVGCRLNQAETAAMRAAFEAAGFQAVPFGRPCDVCVVHGCTVTATAEKDSLRLARAAKRLNRRAFVILAGCVAETGGEDARAACGADLAAGQVEKFNLPEIARRHGIRSGAGKRGCRNPLPRFETTRAVVKIQDGCDFRCAYCIVPSARGNSRSRPLGRIMAEIAGLGEAGYKEVVLTGANIGCYEDDGNKLTGLLERIEKLQLIELFRLSSIEISTIERDVIDFMSGSKKLCRFLHLPLQSGNDRILRAMGRRYNAEYYRGMIEYAIDRLGCLGLGTDVIAGFPGEDEAAFASTEQMISDLPFSNLHVFAYSSRPGTRAAKMHDDVPGTVKKTRAARLARLGRRKRAAFAASQLGRKTSVLIETIDEAGRGIGWTGEYLRAGAVDSGLCPNRIVEFVPDRIEGDVLVGATV